MRTGLIGATAVLLIVGCQNKGQVVRDSCACAAGELCDDGVCRRLCNAPEQCGDCQICRKGLCMPGGCDTCQGAGCQQPEVEDKQCEGPGGAPASDGAACNRKDVAEGLFVCKSGACVESTCGDGFLDARSEECDLGTNTWAAGCSSDCTVPECIRVEDCPAEGPCRPSISCTAGQCEFETQEFGSACDTDGIATSLEFCSGQDCVPSVCGDGIADAHETCDPGLDPASCTQDCENATCINDDGCRHGNPCLSPGRCVNQQCVPPSKLHGTSCTIATASGYCFHGLCRELECGDGIVAGPEQCDDNGTAVDDGCSDDCLYEVGFDCERLGEDGPTECESICGDRLEVGIEVCDDGQNNSDEYNGERHCNANCTAYVPYCGDSRTDSIYGEVCDDGAANSDAYSATQHCNASCTGPAGSCGDGIVQDVEVCDNQQAGCQACQAATGYVCDASTNECALGNCFSDVQCNDHPDGAFCVDHQCSACRVGTDCGDGGFCGAWFCLDPGNGVRECRMHAQNNLGFCGGPGAPLQICIDGTCTGYVTIDEPAGNPSGATDSWSILDVEYYAAVDKFFVLAEHTTDSLRASISEMRPDGTFFPRGDEHAGRGKKIAGGVAVGVNGAVALLGYVRPTSISWNATAIHDSVANAGMSDAELPAVAYVQPHYWIAGKADDDVKLLMLQEDGSDLAEYTVEASEALSVSVHVDGAQVVRPLLVVDNGVRQAPSIYGLNPDGALVEVWDGDLSADGVDELWGAYASAAFASGIAVAVMDDAFSTHFVLFTPQGSTWTREYIGNTAAALQGGGLFQDMTGSSLGLAVLTTTTLQDRQLCVWKGGTQWECKDLPGEDDRRLVQQIALSDTGLRAVGKDLDTSYPIVWSF